MIRAYFAQIDMSARMPTTRPAPTATPLMAETIGVTPQRSIQGSTAIPAVVLSITDLATGCGSVNSPDPTNQSRCKTEYPHVAYLNLRMQKFNPNREKELPLRSAEKLRCQATAVREWNC